MDGLADDFKGRSKHTLKFMLISQNITKTSLNLCIKPSLLLHLLCNESTIHPIYSNYTLKYNYPK